MASAHAAFEFGKPLGAGRDVVAVDQLFFECQVEQAVGERQIGAGGELQVQRRVPCGIGEARVDDDQFAAAALLFEHPLHDGRHGLGAVRAPKQQRASLGEIRDGKRQTSVEAERLIRACRGRRHAVAPVVVDIRRFEHDARELAEQICLLVRQRATAERAHAGGAVLPLEVRDTPGNEVERGVPADRREAPIGAAQERAKQALRMIQQLSRGEPLDAHLPAIHGEFFVCANLQLLGVRVHGRHRHAALKRAIRTVRLDGAGRHFQEARQRIGEHRGFRARTHGALSSPIETCTRPATTRIGNTDKRTLGSSKHCPVSKLKFCL